MLEPQEAIRKIQKQWVGKQWVDLVKDEQSSDVTKLLHHAAGACCCRNLCWQYRWSPARHGSW